MLLAVGLAVFPKFGKKLVLESVCQRFVKCCRPADYLADTARLALLYPDRQELKNFEDSRSVVALDLVGELREENIAWNKAVDMRGLSRFDAVVEGAGKFLFWHVAQPVGYGLVYGCALSAGELDGVQIFFGGLVAVREALYLLMVCACTCVYPAFLLVDVRASVARKAESAFFGGYGFLMMYCLAPGQSIFSYLTSLRVPDLSITLIMRHLLVAWHARCDAVVLVRAEKFVALALFVNYDDKKDTNLQGLSLFGGSFLDFCGLVALGVGFGKGNLPPARELHNPSSSPRAKKSRPARLCKWHTPSANLTLNAFLCSGGGLLRLSARHTVLDWVASRERWLPGTRRHGVKVEGADPAGARGDGLPGAFRALGKLAQHDDLACHRLRCLRSLCALQRLRVCALRPQDPQVCVLPAHTCVFRVQTSTHMQG